MQTFIRFHSLYLVFFLKSHSFTAFCFKVFFLFKTIIFYVSLSLIRSQTLYACKEMSKPELISDVRKVDGENKVIINLKWSPRILRRRSSEASSSQATVAEGPTSALKPLPDIR